MLYPEIIPVLLLKDFYSIRLKQHITLFDINLGGQARPKKIVKTLFGEVNFCCCKALKEPKIGFFPDPRPDSALIEPKAMSIISNE